MGLLLFLDVVCFDDRCFIKFGGRYEYVDVVVVALPFPHFRDGITVNGRQIGGGGVTGPYQLIIAMTAKALFHHLQFLFK